jgi:DNA-binding MarR family transcriptional regulator
MEDRGLLVRVREWGHRRTTHIRLTAEGRSEAEQILFEREMLVTEISRSSLFFDEKNRD